MARDTSPTDRRGYDRPAIGDDWADAWDGLVEDIDKISVERGPIADRPSTGEYDDSLYLATDQRILWRWDGGTSDWEAVSGLGTASDPVPGTSHFEIVNAAEQNNNEINLTRLVEDGTYTDILDAIVNEPATNRSGLRYIIEPGSYDVSTQYTISESHAEFIGLGTADIWNDQPSGIAQPVQINWTGSTGSGERMLTIDGSGVEGLIFRNIAFVATSGSAVTGIYLDGTPGSVTRDITFDRCRWQEFDNPVDNNDSRSNFDYKIRECSIFSNYGPARFGGQTVFKDNFANPKSGVTAVELGNKSRASGTVATLAGSSTTILKLRDNCSARPRNMEGDGSSGQVAIEISSKTKSPSRVLSGTIAGADTAIDVVSGAAHIGPGLSLTNTTNPKIKFSGGNNDHNNYKIIGLDPTEISFNSLLQTGLWIPSAPVSNLNTTDVPGGFIAIDTDRGGTGNAAWISSVKSTSTSSTIHYVDFGGTL